jgi:hypothetical protein
MDNLEEIKYKKIKSLFEYVDHEVACGLVLHKYFPSEIKKLINNLNINEINQCYINAYYIDEKNFFFNLKQKLEDIKNLNI